MDLAPLSLPLTVLTVGLIVGTLLIINNVSEGFAEWLSILRERNEAVPFAQDVLTERHHQLEIGNFATGKPTGEYVIIHSQDLLRYTVENEDGQLRVTVMVSCYDSQITAHTYYAVETGAQDFLNWVGNERYNTNSDDN